MPRYFAFLLVLVIGWFVAKSIVIVLRQGSGRRGVGAIMATGLFAALSQLQIASAIVNGLFYAVLAIVVGSAVIAIGGGRIQPMRTQWEKTMAKLEEELPQARREAQGAKDRIAAWGQELKGKAT